jgi:hypothetical protein
MLLEWSWASTVCLIIWSMYWALVERENLNTFGVNTMFCVEALFCYCQYYWLSEAGVPLVFFQR